MYNQEIISQSCMVDNRLVGLPLYCDFGIMYSNIDLLHKYNKEIPQTWEELYETGYEVMKGESNNDSDLIIFNGLGADDEIGTCFIYELLYSFRDSKNSTLPDFSSKESLDAFNMISKLKTLLNDYTSSDITIVNSLYSGNSLFLRYWYMPDIPFYTISRLPGKNKDVSGSIIGGYNIGISKYSPKDHQDSSIIVLKYFTSKDIQRKLSKDKKLISAIFSLYDEEEVC
ncbi:periplasmic binding protein-like II, partial [Piromyces finnis]